MIPESGGQPPDKVANKNMTLSNANLPPHCLPKPVALQARYHAPVALLFSKAICFAFHSGAIFCCLKNLVIQF
ncbi:unnamed protein product [Cylicocyclus nassatus]|uniref:Uncharacterized protein n=1 Tax=Cylicocyclus nassatus TaxID=53992 RepID=A0AA36GKF4_CYLNA|nr:unnamed protein product [Cylicocyclus nassatus]